MTGPVEIPLHRVRVERGGKPLIFSSWRGRTGRQHVVCVHALDSLTPDHFGLSVAIAVRRVECGRAEAVFVSALPCAGNNAQAAAAAWLQRARLLGATEAHLNRLPKTWYGANEVVRDLIGGAMASDQYQVDPFTPVTFLRRGV